MSTSGDLAATGRARGRPGRPSTPGAPDAEWLTWEQAAARVGCPVATIDWHTRTGRIVTRPRDGGQPTVSAGSLEGFATWWHSREEWRAATAEQRAVHRERHTRPSEPDEPPADGGPWLSTAEAAELLGCSSSTVGRLVAEGRLVGRRRGRRVWVTAVSVTSEASERTLWLSHARAAALVGCPKAVISAAVDDGRISRRTDAGPGRASLSRASVEEFAAQWQAGRRAEEASAATARLEAETQRREAYGPPTGDGQVWLDVKTTALVLGLGRTRVQQLAAGGRLPHVRTRAGRLWFRRDHVEVAAAARARVRAH